MQSRELKNRSHALRAIIHHYCWSKEKGLNREEIALKLGLDAKALGNFLNDSSEAHEGEIRERFRKIVAKEDYRRNKPGHIIAAIEEVYDLRSTASIDRVFDQIASHDTTLIRRVSDCYSGTWDLFRYAAHQEVKATEVSQSEPKWDAYVVRTALRVDPCDQDGTEFPLFEISYKPLSPRDGGKVKSSEGSVVPLAAGPYLGFFGVEQNTLYPLDIRTPRYNTSQDFFKGIVKRHLESGHVVTSRVAFVRSQATTLEDLEPKLGVFPESRIKEMCKDELPTLGEILESVENRVEYGGKSCLWL